MHVGYVRVVNVLTDDFYADAKEDVLRRSMYGVWFFQNMKILLI